MVGNTVLGRLSDGVINSRPLVGSDDQLIVTAVLPGPDLKLDTDCLTPDYKAPNTILPGVEQVDRFLARHKM